MRLQTSDLRPSQPPVCKGHKNLKVQGLRVKNLKASGVGVLNSDSGKSSVCHSWAK